MQIEYYSLVLLRVVAVVGIIAVQAYLLFSIGIEEGVVMALFYQCALQAAAAFVAPAGLRFFAAVAAGWVSGLLAAALAVTWGTVVIPASALIGAMRFGDYSGLLTLFALTTYLLVPCAIAYAASAVDE